MLDRSSNKKHTIPNLYDEFVEMSKTAAEETEDKQFFI